MGGIIFICVVSLTGCLRHLHRTQEPYYLIPPQPHRFVLASASDFLPIRTPIYRIHLIVVTRQVLGELARARIPHFERVVARAGDEEPAVGREGALVDVGDVTAEGVDEFAVAEFVQI